MKKTDYITALTNIDDCFVEEAAMHASDPKTARKLSKRFIAVAVAAVLVLLTTVVCFGNDGSIVVDIVESDLFQYDGKLEPGEVRLMELCEEYGIPTDFDISGGLWLEEKHCGDYYYEYGWVKTSSKIFAFYITNDDLSEIKIETHQYLCKNDIDEFESVDQFREVEEFKTDTKYIKNNGTTVLIHDVEEGWHIFGSYVYFSGEALNEYRPFAENMWYGKLYGGGGYSQLNENATEFVESIEDVILSDSYRNEFINR